MPKALRDAHKDRINKAVFALYGVDGLPGA
jgi:hypothetical protein